MNVELSRQIFKKLLILTNSTQLCEKTQPNPAFTQKLRLAQEHPLENSPHIHVYLDHTPPIISDYS